MNLKKWDRVIYNPNPLIEVVAQVRFPRILEIDEHLPYDYHKRIRDTYPFIEIQEDSVLFTITQGDSKSVSNDLPKTRLYHFISIDRSWRVSLSSEFIALTCDKYEKWEDFIPKMMQALLVLSELYGIKLITRIGLRYRDLIIREDVGLSGVSWRELIAPFLLSAIIPDQLAEDGEVPESNVLTAQSYVGLMLDDCQLSLRHGLVQKEPKGESAYIIDADYFVDNQTLNFNLYETKSCFDKFHANAGSVFRSCIQERLHNALNPTPLA